VLLNALRDRPVPVPSRVSVDLAASNKCHLRAEAIKLQTAAVHGQH
jgi:hypothetical protein